MKMAKSARVLDQLVAQLGDCLTPESARRLLALKADPKLQARVDGFGQASQPGFAYTRGAGGIRAITFTTARSLPS